MTLSVRCRHSLPIPGGEVTNSISHAEAHEDWSEKQLELFREMGRRERLNALESGALENWTANTRTAALDLLGDIETTPTASPSTQTVRFERASYPLPLLPMRAPRMDRFMIGTWGGWTALILATAAYAYELY